MRIKETRKREMRKITQREMLHSKTTGYESENKKE